MDTVPEPKRRPTLAFFDTGCSGTAVREGVLGVGGPAAQATDEWKVLISRADHKMLAGDEAPLSTSTQLQPHENAAAEEREDTELPLRPRACVSSDERSLDFKEWGELIDYRCIKCFSCNNCRDADQTEKISLRQDTEDDMIEYSVSFDYANKQIIATLLLKGKEEECLSPYQDRATCVLNQKCKKLKGKPDDIKAVQKSVDKLFDRGHIKFVEDPSEDI